MVQNIMEKKNPGPSNHFEQLVAKSNRHQPSPITNHHIVCGFVNHKSPNMLEKA
jgi:hypothetical protein